MVTSYYNENNPFAAHLLRVLMAEDVIAPGVIDDRSIKDVHPNDIAGFDQCHFFAGGGLWSVAARLAGWPDDRPLWTASCPCQPFSQAGKGAGVDDPRHLWPDLHRIVAARRPDVLVGEQVAGAAGYGWLDGVRADLAGEGYASRGVDIPACAVDAPHIRQRLYWIAVADADGRGRAGRAEAPERVALGRAAAERSDGLEHTPRFGRGEGRAEHELRGGRATAADADASGVTMGDAFIPRLEGQRGHGDDARRWPVAAGSASAPDGRDDIAWADAEWLPCHDGKARRAKPGLRLLVDGIPGRVDLWRVAGNAIVVPLAAEVIGALMDVEGAW